jgi:anti-sigma regulatory factor (Ser/Thr protein kinase)
MSMLGAQETPQRLGAFRHEALFYEGLAGFLAGTLGFVREGVAAGEPVMVVVAAHKIAHMREALGDCADAVTFYDMNDVGLNPARIIPAWVDFVNDHAPSGASFRGIGEPIWAERTPDQLIECERHEALLNLAFADSPSWRLLCPYDTTSLAPQVVTEAKKNHPYILQDGAMAESNGYRTLNDIIRPFDLPLPEPPDTAQTLSFAGGDLSVVRALAAAKAAELGLAEQRIPDLLIAVSEIATNSIRHGGGAGTLRIWSSDRYVIAEVRDRGRIEDPLVGRRKPSPTDEGGIGMWLVNQLCDLVQVRTLADGSVVRVHLAR